MKKPLVTILSPVYNGEDYLARFLDSILNQDYDNIEFILVNDGSVDNTDKVVKSYTKKLKEKLTGFKYIKQDNSGAAGAINNGLKYVNGKYLTWPDSDDILTPDSISMKVDFLEHHNEYGYVRTDGLAFNENNLEKPLYRFYVKRYKENLFYDFLFDTPNIYFCIGCYMVRMSSFKKVNPHLEIYVTKGGQNWQMLLPISYYEKCGYINRVGYYYIERSNSHSHNQKTYSDYIKKYNGYEDIILNVLSTMKIEDYQLLQEKIKIKYSKARLEYAVEYGNIDDFKKEYTYLKEHNALSIKIRIYNICSNKKIIKLIYSSFEGLFSIPKRMIRKIKKVCSNND